jgi:hypothetical protein
MSSITTSTNKERTDNVILASSESDTFEKVAAER